MNITPDRLGTVRAGDRITAIDGRPTNYTVTRTLGPVGVGGNQAIVMTCPDRDGEINLYPDTHVDRSITIERPGSAAKIEPIDRRNASSINAGDHLIVEDTEHGMRATRRKTGVKVVTVTSKEKTGYRCYRIMTTGGELISPAAGVFGIAAEAAQ